MHVHYQKKIESNAYEKNIKKEDIEIHTTDRDFSKIKV